MIEERTSTGIRCPYCGETVEILLESDLEGELVQDCEVCCNPWSLQINRREGAVEVDARRLDD